MCVCIGFFIFSGASRNTPGISRETLRNQPRGSPCFLWAECFFISILTMKTSRNIVDNTPIGSSLFHYSLFGHFRSVAGTNLALPLRSSILSRHFPRDLQEHFTESPEGFNAQLPTCHGIVAHFISTSSKHPVSLIFYIWKRRYLGNSPKSA